MEEEPFRVSVGDGFLVGARGGQGPPALLLHGGAAVTDYMDACADELAAIFHTIRYQQRGTPPSEVGPPYTIETHVEDALAVLDALGVDRAWAIGHSWGGHLALHLAVTHPERLLGLVCIDALGADPGVFAAHDANLRRGLSDSEIARIEEVEVLRRKGQASEADLLERFSLIWPRWFADPASAPPNPVRRIGARSSTETNASTAEHFARGTLAARLPDVRLPALFLHGQRDPMPLESSRFTAGLIPGARLETIAGAGHFPWLERPGEVRRVVADFLAR